MGDRTGFGVVGSCVRTGFDVVVRAFGRGSTPWVRAFGRGSTSCFRAAGRRSASCFRAFGRGSASWVRAAGRAAQRSALGYFRGRPFGADAQVPRSVAARTALILGVGPPALKGPTIPAQGNALGGANREGCCVSPSGGTRGFSHGKGQARTVRALAGSSWKFRQGGPSDSGSSRKFGGSRAQHAAPLRNQARGFGRPDRAAKSTIRRAPASKPPAHKRVPFLAVDR